MNLIVLNSESNLNKVQTGKINTMTYVTSSNAMFQVILFLLCFDAICGMYTFMPFGLNRIEIKTMRGVKQYSYVCGYSLVLSR